MKISDNSAGDFIQPQPGSYAARCYKLIDIGTQTSTYQGKELKRHQVIIGWELDQFMPSGKLFVVSAFYTASLHEKATLRKHLEGWRGRAFSEQELKGMELKTIMGKTCLLSLTLPNKGKIKVASISAVPAKMPVPEPANDQIYFDLSEFNESVFNGFSEGLRLLISRSPEYHKAITGEAESEAIPTEEKSVDDIPF